MTTTITSLTPTRTTAASAAISVVSADRTSATPSALRADDHASTELAAQGSSDAAAATETGTDPAALTALPGGSRGWPASPLAAADTAFGWLCRGPRPLSLDTTTIPGLPDEPVELDRLKTLLLDRATSRPARDAVWRQVVLKAQSGRPEWVIAAVGLAMPGLRQQAGRLTAGWRGETTDIDAEMLTAFLAELRAVDPDCPRLCQRLCRAAEAAGRTIRHASATAPLPHSDHPESQAPQRPYGHPDLVLGRAVRAGVITVEEADLIGRTRLDGEPIAECAAALGVQTHAMIMRRSRAEARLVAQIRCGRLNGLLREAEADPAGIA